MIDDCTCNEISLNVIYLTNNDHFVTDISQLFLWNTRDILISNIEHDVRNKNIVFNDPDDLFNACYLMINKNTLTRFSFTYDDIETLCMYEECCDPYYDYSCECSDINISDEILIDQCFGFDSQCCIEVYIYPVSKDFLITLDITDGKSVKHTLTKYLSNNPNFQTVEFCNDEMNIPFHSIVGISVTFDLLFPDSDIYIKSIEICNPDLSYEEVLLDECMYF